MVSCGTYAWRTTPRGSIPETRASLGFELQCSTQCTIIDHHGGDDDDEDDRNVNTQDDEDVNINDEDDDDKYFNLKDQIYNKFLSVNNNDIDSAWEL